MSYQPNFIVIDDDPFNNKICKLFLQKFIGDVAVETFTEPEVAINYLANYTPPDTEPSIVLLDINMPTMTGWEFLDEYDHLDASVKNSLKVYILSSSVDERDKERAAQNKNVVDYLIKPLTADVVGKLLNN
ncbi:response regulator [Oscillatoria amoena NRMC-F 0135]|jgi:CheY-like chemotaxis protein|nr:response regulator [Oscillatoria amoena NRMC-F 0135]